MKKTFFLIIVLLSFAINTFSQTQTDSTTKKISLLTDVTIYSTKFPENNKKLSQTIVSIDKNILSNQANTADALINSGAAFVQKSQQGGGSPIIRGFEASRVLLTIDGIKLNNAIYRTGHLQNIITVDNMILDKMEVQYGPSSTIYGSDALGGSINMFTKNPELSSNKKSLISGNAVIKYASAIEENRGHIDFNIGSTQWAFLTSITYGKFGDVKQGANRSDAYSNFGKQNFIVKRWGNTDSAFINSDPNKQSPSGYEQIDFTQKILFQPLANTQHILNVQLSNTNNIPRYDRLTEVASGNPVYAEWFYGPQTRNLVAYHFNITKLKGFINDFKITANYQDIEESRITRRFKNNNRDTRVESVNVFGVNIDAKHYTKKSEFQFGLESYMNFVRSTAQRDNIVSGATSRITTRYSDGPTKTSSNALYIQHTYKINNNLTLNEGVRLNLVKLNAVFADTTLMHFPFTSAKQNNFAVTGNIGLVYNSKNNIRIAAILNSGFRSPNVDDLTKVFDTKTSYVVVPNTNIKPEYTYNAEINFSQQIGIFKYGFALFNTWFSNAIVVDKFTFNGADSLNYQGVKSAIYAPQNKAKAVVYGYSAYGEIQIEKNTKLAGMYNYTFGDYTNENSTMPLDHIPPAYGKISIAHNKGKCFAEINSIFNSWKRIDRYNKNGEDNEIYATPEGMPSWFTLNFIATYQVNKTFRINASIENLLDKNYRYFASGISAPGRNFIISLKANF